MKLKEFVLFRHAQKASWTQDPDLSKEGHEQAQQLIRWVQDKKLPTPQRLLSSPRKRAQQTFTPLQEALSVPLIIESSLDERLHSETGKIFEARVRQFLTTTLFEQNAETLYLVTHMDWLEVFSWAAPITVDLGSTIYGIPPAQFFHFSVTHGTDEPWVLLNQGAIR